MTPRHSDEEGRGKEPSPADDDWAYGDEDLGDGDIDDDIDDDAALDDGLDPDDDVWTEEDERRYQARRQQERLRARRRRRQATSFAVVVLVVLAAGLGAVGLYLGWWSWPPGGGAASPPATPQTCPQPTPTAAAAKDVSVTVLNSTDHQGLAASVAQQLSARGFVIAGVGNDPAHGSVQEAAQVRHGPEGLMGARTVAAQIKGAVPVDDGRTGSSVDVSLGAAFTDLNTPEQAAALTAPPPVPSPSGCVSG